MTRRRNQPPDPAPERPEPTDLRLSRGANRKLTPAPGGNSPPTGESRYRRRRTPAPEEAPLLVRVDRSSWDESINVSRVITVVAPTDPPEVRGGAARALLRLLRNVFDRRGATGDQRP